VIYRHRRLDCFEGWLTIYEERSDHVWEEDGIAHREDGQVAREAIGGVVIGSMTQIV
jgi:hypothetical protein